MDSYNHSDPKDEQLKCWTVDKAVDLQRGVWQRIAADGTGNVPWWTGFWTMIDAWLLKPAVALSVCILFVGMGLSVGQMKRQANVQRTPRLWSMTTGTLSIHFKRFRNCHETLPDNPDACNGSWAGELLLRRQARPCC